MPWFRAHVLHNLPLKVVALVIAGWLWAVVAREPVAEVGLSIHVEFHDVPDSLEIASEELPEAHVRLRGPARLVRSVQPDEVHATIDLSGVQPGERTFDLQPSSVRAPAGVAVSPAYVTVTGPAKRVNALQAALTDPIDATGVVGQATFTTNTYVPDPLVRLVRPTTIHVTIATEKQSAAVADPPIR